MSSEQQEALPTSRHRNNKRLTFIISAGIVATLAVAAGIIIPQVSYSQRVAEYTQLSGELQSALDEKATAETAHQAAVALTFARHEEALAMSGKVAELGKTKEPILPNSQAELIESISSVALKELESFHEVESLDEAIEEIYSLLQSNFLAMRDAETTTEPDIPESFAMMSINQARDLIARPIVPEKFTAVADEDITHELIEELKITLDNVRNEVTEVQQALGREEGRHEFIETTMRSLLPVLQETAAAVGEYAEAVEKDTPKAKDAVKEKTSVAALRVRDIATSDDVFLLYERVQSYVTAGEASLADHAKVVKAEEAAKAKKRSSQKKSSDGWASGGLCNYWSPLDGGMYMAPC